MLAANKGHKDIVLILTQKGANLEVVNKVSIYLHITRHNLIVFYNFHLNS